MKGDVCYLFLLCERWLTLAQFLAVGKFSYTSLEEESTLLTPSLSFMVPAGWDQYGSVDPLSQPIQGALPVSALTKLTVGWIVHCLIYIWGLLLTVCFSSAENWVLVAALSQALSPLSVLTHLINASVFLMANICAFPPRHKVGMLCSTQPLGYGWRKKVGQFLTSLVLFAEGYLPQHFLTPLHSDNPTWFTWWDWCS